MTDVREAARTMRQRIGDEGFVERLRASAPGLGFLSQVELDASLDQVLREHDPEADVHVFGYGSLMWNPALEHRYSCKAEIRGWHRSFCLHSHIGRGCAEHPGLMLALDAGGACAGMIICIDAAKSRDELRLLWRREMLTGAYVARWISASTPRGAVRALTFIVNHSHPRYVRGLSVEQMAHLINTGRGALGTCREYFDATVTKLRALGIRDATMERLSVALGGGDISVRLTNSFIGP